MREDLIREFEKTRAFSKKLRLGVEYIIYEEYAGRGCPQNIVWEYEDTVKAILESKGKVAALNFADSYSIGGLVWQGVKTQEEDLCRSSNLYESLVCAERFYEYKGDDWIMYNKNILFFRDSKLNWLPPSEVRVVDIISASAPIGGSDEEVKKRMKGILWIAKKNGVETLILGKWGCGAFGNDWDRFRLLWEECIAEARDDGDKE